MDQTHPNRDGPIPSLTTVYPWGRKTSASRRKKPASEKLTIGTSDQQVFGGSVSEAPKAKARLLV